MSVRVAPDTIATPLANDADHRKLPDEAESQKLIPVRVSAEPPHDDHVGVFDNDKTPDDAAEKVAAGRVVTLDTFAVPAAPGAPVCNCTYTADGAVKAVPRNRLSHDPAR